MNDTDSPFIRLLSSDEAERFGQMFNHRYTAPADYGLSDELISILVELGALLPTNTTEEPPSESEQYEVNEYNPLSKLAQAPHSDRLFANERVIRTLNEYIVYDELSALDTEIIAETTTLSKQEAIDAHEALETLELLQPELFSPQRRVPETIERDDDEQLIVMTEEEFRNIAQRANDLGSYTITTTRTPPQQKPGTTGYRLNKDSPLVSAAIDLNLELYSVVRSINNYFD